MCALSIFMRLPIGERNAEMAYKAVAAAMTGVVPVIEANSEIVQGLVDPGGGGANAPEFT